MGVHLKRHPGNCDLRQSLGLGRIRWVGVAFVIVAIAFAPASVSADTPPGSALGRARSIQEIEAIADPHARCLAAMGVADQLIGGENADALGDFLIDARETPPGARPYEDVARALDIAEHTIDRIPKDDRKALTAHISILRRFNAVFLAICRSSNATTQSDDTSLMDAASELAENLDDANAALAESARLWQAVAYWRAGKADRALKILKPIVSAPADARIGLLSRLFRCRLLADSGQQAAALAHCTRIAYRMPRWFDSESDETRQAAANTIRFVEVNIHEAWLKKLRAVGDETGAAAVAAKLAEVKKKAPDGSGNERLKLTTTIGGLSPVDAKPEKASATTEPTGD